MAGHKPNRPGARQSGRASAKVSSYRFEVFEGGLRAPSIDPREERLFRSLDLDNTQSVRRGDLERMLAEAGLRGEDIRLRESMAALNDYENRAARPVDRQPDAAIPIDGFCTVIRPNIALIERALQGTMVVPDFAAFCADIGHIYDLAKENRSGKAADYIPQLDLREPDLDRFGGSLCTIDGQRYSIGDSQVFFPLESTCKPINYCAALEEHGESTVHAYIGHEPSGVSFNELALNRTIGRTIR